MTMAISADDEALRETYDALADLQATADEMLKTLDSDGEVSRKVNKMINLGAVTTYESYRKVQQEIHRLSREAVERAQQVWESIKAQVQCMRLPKMQRDQGRSSGSAKPAAKKNASSSGGSSGEGGGDGDGPARTPSKSKKHRSKPRSTSLQHPPSSSPGEIATTSFLQVSPHRPLPGREIVPLVILCLYGIANIVPSEILQGLIIFSLVIIALVAMGYPEVARYVWSTVPKLLKQLATDADEEIEDPDEES